MSELKVTLPRLHPAQREILQSTARFKVIAAGRRFGKTRLAAVFSLSEALQNKTIWWVSPTFPIGTIAWRLLKRISRPIPGILVKEVERRIEYPGAGSITLKSADREDSLRGEGLDGLVIDEAAFLREAAWTQELRAAIADRKGWVIFISTPKGRNWFFRLWSSCGDLDGWHAFQYPTAANPFIDAAEIEDARGLLPDRIFRQEFMAEFLADDLGVFRGVEAASILQRDHRHPDQARDCVFGVDWGKVEDFTVITSVYSNGEQLFLARYNKIDYAFQRKHLEALYERWKPRKIIAERNAMGEPIIEELRRAGLPVEGFTTTQQSKAKIIEALALAVEKGDLKLLDDPQQKIELQAYDVVMGPTGIPKYGAPEGFHDDCVMALALAWYGASAPMQFRVEAI